MAESEIKIHTSVGGGPRTKRKSFPRKPSTVEKPTPTDTNAVEPLEASRIQRHDKILKRFKGADGK